MKIPDHIDVVEAIEALSKRSAIEKFLFAMDLSDCLTGILEKDDILRLFILYMAHKCGYYFEHNGDRISLMPYEYSNDLESIAKKLWVDSGKKTMRCSPLSRPKNAKIKQKFLGY